MASEKIIQKKHMMHFAGKVWIFDQVEFVKDLEGDLSITGKEMLRLQRAVGNAVCGNATALTKDELDFLCECTSTNGKEIASLVFCDPSNVTKWRNQGKVPMLESLILKEFFWIKLFGEGLSIKTDLFGSRRLAQLSSKALAEHLADPVSNKAA
jgi:hypothetical protein